MSRPSPSSGRGSVVALPRVQAAGGDKQTDSVHSSEVDVMESG